MNTINIIKTTLLVVLLSVLFTSITVNAQPPGRQQGPPPIPNSSQINKMVDELTTELLLNEEQKATIKTLYINHFKEVREKTESKNVDQKAMEKLKAGLDRDIKELLSEEQKIKFIVYQNKLQTKQSRRQR